MGRWWPWSSRGRTNQPPQPLPLAQATLARCAPYELVPNMFHRQIKPFMEACLVRDPRRLNIQKYRHS